MALTTFDSGVVPLTSTAGQWLANVIAQNPVANAQSVGGWVAIEVGSDRAAYSVILSR